MRGGRLRGIQFSENGPMIHHMLFADDSLMICKASLGQVSELLQILQVYEKATGQTVNLDKSAITFGAKLDEICKQLLRDLLGIEKEGGTWSYLGLPECFSRSKTDMLAYIYDRLKDRLSCWFVKLLSQGGKEVLIKAVAMAMSVYAMSCFKLTKKSCENLTKAMANFWWNALKHKRKIHWLSWTKLCLAKEQGVWALKTYIGSINLLWPSKRGEYSTIPNLSLLESSKADTLSMVISFLLVMVLDPLTDGGVSSLAKSCLNKVSGNMLEMVTLSRSG